MRKASIASVLFILALAVCIGSCHEPVHKVLYVDSNCKLLDETGNEVTLVDLKVGWRVRWRNNSGSTVKLVTDMPKIFAGRRSIRLAQGEEVEYRVGTRLGAFYLKWYCMPEHGGTITGSGGSPGKTEECTPTPCNPPCQTPPCP